MSIEIPEGYMENAMGHLVPIAQIKEQDLLRDRVVFDIFEEAAGLHDALTKFKRRAFAELLDLVKIAGEKHGVSLGGSKGNLSLTTFNGRYMVKRSVATVITFTEELQAAKALIEGCIHRWSDGADTRIAALVMRAFKPNTNGELRTAAVLDLLKFDMKDANGDQDAEWARAMEALKDSIQSSGTTAYINVYERIGSSDKYRHIPLDLAAV